MPTIHNTTFLSLVQDGYLRDYLDMMVEMKNEMPLAFHFLSMLTVLGNAIGFNTWGYLDRGVNIYPNVNALLLSPAGKCRRGEGSKFAVRIARRAGMRIHEGKTTPEGLADALADDENLLLYVEELSVLFSKRDYLRDIIPFLTKALLNSGGVIEERTRGSGLLRINRANLSALFTSAPDWFIQTMPAEASDGGFLSRVLPCYIPRREVIHVDLLAGAYEKEDEEKFKSMSDDFAKVIKRAPKGCMEVDDKAAGWFEQWYFKNETMDVEDDRMDPHRNRAPANVLRIAMLLAISNKEKTIKKVRLKQAIDILDYITPTLWAMYGYTDSKLVNEGRLEKRVVKLLSVNGGEMVHADLMQGTYSYAKNRAVYRDALLSMVERGMLEMVQKQGVPALYWPPLGWRLVK